MTGKVLLDTNIFIDWLREGMHEEWVCGRSRRLVRFLSSIVVMELCLGADSPRRRRAVASLTRAFPPGRIVTPSAEVHQRAGSLFSAIFGHPSGDRLGTMNDLLIALTAWRIGGAVVTRNSTDFRRIARHVPGLKIIAA